MTLTSPPDLPFNRLWWFYVPLLMLAVQIALECLFDSPTLALMHTEGGPHEAIQFLLLLGALGSAAVTLTHTRDPVLIVWLALAALSCLYVAGEEISWGQHIAKWTTPEFWSTVNDQNETNFHNTSSWLDQKPRLMLELGIVVGGLIIPALRVLKPGLLPARFAVIYPPAALGVVAALVVVIKGCDIYTDMTGVRLFERGSEVEELYLYYFVLLYMLVLQHRVFIK